MTYLTDADHDAMVAKIKDAFYEARDHGRTMHQAAEDERIHTLVEAIVRCHRAEAWSEADACVRAEYDLEYARLSDRHGGADPRLEPMLNNYLAGIKVAAVTLTEDNPYREADDA